jgi:hypothetical protein
MPLTPEALTRKIKDILRHSRPLPDEAKAPILHYRRAVADVWGSLGYVERLIAERDRYQSVVDRHLGRLYGMALVNLVEILERFFKEAAGECVDCLSDLVLDDRFNVFAIQGMTLASHFGAGTLGKSLCESSTWLDCEDINKRFRKLLCNPFQEGGASFDLFPKQNQQPEAERWRFEPMNVIWQIRHTSVHNVGVITQSDGVKLRLLAKEPVAAPRLLAPTRADLGYLKQFLDDTAVNCNKRIGERLAELLTTIHTATPTLFTPQARADKLGAIFRLPLVVAGAAGAVPPD